MDVSSQLNNWIALTAELEDTRETIAKAVYKHYKAGRIVDDYTCDMCRKIDGLFDQSKEYQEWLRDDFKAFLDVDETKKDFGSKAKAKAMNFLTQAYINHQVSGYKKSFREAYVELGLRAITMIDNGQDLISDPKVVQLCRYAMRLQKDCDNRWEEITILQRENKRGNIFVNLIQNFMVQFTAFSRTQSIPLLNKFVKPDEQLQKKIREQYRKAMLTVQSGSR